MLIYIAIFACAAGLSWMIYRLVPMFLMLSLIAIWGNLLTIAARKSGKLFAPSDLATATPA
jgi:hypothetical protein